MPSLPCVTGIFTCVVEGWWCPGRGGRGKEHGALTHTYWVHILAPSFTSHEALCKSLHLPGNMG